MRTTLTIPNEYYEKIKTVYREQGYQTINALMLELIRNHFGKSHQSNAPQMSVVTKDKKLPVKKPKNKLTAGMCEHGYLASMCKFDKCRNKA